MRRRDACWGRTMATLARRFALLLSSFALAGCVAVPMNRRARLADPMMRLTDDPIEAARKQKLYTSREGAAGGDGVSAGGGCGCN